MQTRQNRTKVGLKHVDWQEQSIETLQAKSNQGGIETERTPGGCAGIVLAKSNQGGIETATRSSSACCTSRGKIEPRWD